MNFDDEKIAFIGAGQMATALASGFARSFVLPTAISACDPSEEARERFLSAVGDGVKISGVMGDVVSDATIVFLAVKPQVMFAALEELSTSVTPDHLVVSIAAGIPLKQLESRMPSGTRVIRVMPNTPCLVGKGASGISAGKHATPGDVELITTLLQTAGLAEVFPESLLDAVTGLSGSGPAYAFQIIEALSDGGVKVGLPRAAATRLAAQTLLGAAEMVLRTGRHPAELKDGVTSPGGTTIAALHALEQGGLRAALMDAVEASTVRSRELGAG
ncbi:MAG: pyrroline-5-carboxylate reductase [Planctomycetaceae bacterium]|nr:pyrroline-5-carboxylate reductase [Planctomycetaceae bacterium]